MVRLRSEVELLKPRVQQLQTKLELADKQNIEVSTSSCPDLGYTKNNNGTDKVPDPLKMQGSAVLI